MYSPKKRSHGDLLPTDKANTTALSVSLMQHNGLDL